MRKSLVLAILITIFNSAHANNIKISESCDLSTLTVPVNFHGHRADDVVRDLKRVNTQTGEYESENSYAERLEDSAKNLSHAISIGSICVVDQNLGLGNTKYEPESSTLLVNIFLNNPQFWFDGKNSHRDFKIFVSEKNRKESSYIGSNAFGVSVRVFKTERTATYVTFNSRSTESVLKLAGAINDGVNISIPIDLPPIKAKELHGNIKVAYEYRLRVPFIGAHEYITKPKIDSPFETKERQILIAAELRKLVIFDRKTGEALKRITLSTDAEPTRWRSKGHQ